MKHSDLDKYKKIKRNNLIAGVALVGALIYFVYPFINFDDEVGMVYMLHLFYAFPLLVAAVVSFLITFEQLYKINKKGGFEKSKKINASRIARAVFLGVAIFIVGYIALGIITNRIQHIIGYF